ncbi:MAG: helix-turn-helix domain-containing protein [Desulfovibrio sp.]|nr:helix-turn-helix domain-containing protein [Desulfovibrio sp.]
MSLSARAGLGLSQQGFAKLLGISARTLHDWEQGRREPSGSAKTLLKIAARYPEALQNVMQQHDSP